MFIFRCGVKINSEKNLDSCLGWEIDSFISEERMKNSKREAEYEFNETKTVAADQADFRGIRIS